MKNLCSTPWGVAALWLLPAAIAAAGPPRINTVFPPAIERGKETRIQFVGTGLGAAMELVAPPMLEVIRPSVGPAATASAVPANAATPSFVSEAAYLVVKPSADTPAGVYPVRVRTSEGISNLRLIEVTDLPVVNAREPNGRYRNGKLDLEQAQPITWPTVVAGGRLASDVDVFRFRVEAGERLTFVTETRRLGLTPDPLIRLRDAGGRTLAYRHDTPGLARDERLDYTFDKAGEYFVELQSEGVTGWNNHYLLKISPLDYARSVFPLGGRRGESVQFEIAGRDGQNEFTYASVPLDPWSDHWRLPLPRHTVSLDWRLAAGDLPEIVEQPRTTEDGYLKDGEPRSIAEPQLVVWPATVNGRIGRAGESDLYQLAVTPGQTVRFEIEAYYLGSSLDGTLLVYDPIGEKLLGQGDDQVARGNPDPALDVTIPEGVKQVVVAVSDCRQRGGVEFGYRLTIEQGGPDFYLWLGKAQNAYKTNEENESWFRMDASDTLNLPIGAATKLRVSVRRVRKENDPFYKGPRQGFSGPIRLRAVEVPRGVTVEPATIPAGGLEGELTVVAAANAPREPFEIVVIGEGTRDDGVVVRRVAERRLYLADPQMFALPWNWRVQKVACAVVERQEKPE